jgi:uncharacterized coiled-coil protein SlyX
MLDTPASRQRPRHDRAATGARQLWMFGVALAVIVIGLGCVLLQRGFSGNGTPPGSPTVALAGPEQVAQELLETTKGLQVTQQQAVDQLQVVQDQLVAQREETKKLSDQIAAVTEKLEAVQQSVAAVPAPAPGSPPKSHH